MKKKKKKKKSKKEKKTRKGGGREENGDKLHTFSPIATHEGAERSHEEMVKYLTRSPRAPPA
jgi:hypothetical protein